MKSATRMELRRLKTRLATAKKGHRMLKDKADELLRRQIAEEQRARALRARVNAELPSALSAFALASAACPEGVFEESLLMPAGRLEADCGIAHILSVPVPRISVRREEGREFVPYSFASMPAEADVGIRLLSGLLPRLLELAEAETAAARLGEEALRTRRRVNALEYVMIPEAEREIREILMKLEENERSSRVRLMKIKAKLH